MTFALRWRGGCPFLPKTTHNWIRHFVYFYFVHVSYHILLTRFVLLYALFVVCDILDSTWFINQFGLHISVKYNFLTAVNNLGLINRHAPILAPTHIQSRREITLCTLSSMFGCENLIMLLNDFLLSFRGLKDLNTLLMVPHLIIDFSLDRILVPNIHRIETWLLNDSLYYRVFTLSSFFDWVH